MSSSLGNLKYFGGKFGTIENLWLLLLPERIVGCGVAYAAPVVRGEDNESVVVLPGLLQGLHYPAHTEVHRSQHGQVDSPVRGGHGGRNTGQVLTGYLQLIVMI